MPFDFLLFFVDVASCCE